MPRVYVGKTDATWFYADGESGDPCVVDVPQELYDRHKKLELEYHLVTQDLEHYYRHCNGYDPLPGSPFK